MILYGLAPVGLDLHRKSSLVLVTSLSLQQMEVIQPANFWVGPSAVSYFQSLYSKDVRMSLDKLFFTSFREI